MMRRNIPNKVQASQITGQFVPIRNAIFQGDFSFVFKRHPFIKSRQHPEIPHLYRGPDRETSVVGQIVFNKRRVTSAVNLLLIFLQPMLMVCFLKFGINFFAEISMKACRILMGTSIPLSQQMGNVDTQRHFDPFKGIQRQQAQLLVKDIQSDQITKLAPCNKIVTAQFGNLTIIVAPELTKRIPVATQAVIPQALQIPFCPIRIFDLQPS